MIEAMQDQGKKDKDDFAEALANAAEEDLEDVEAAGLRPTDITASRPKVLSLWSRRRCFLQVKMTIQKRLFIIFIEYISAERYSRKTILRSSSTLRSKVYSDGGIKTKIFALFVIHDMLYIKGLLNPLLRRRFMPKLKSILKVSSYCSTHPTSDAHVYQSTAEPTIDLFIYNIGDLQFNEDARGENTYRKTAFRVSIRPPTEREGEADSETRSNMYRRRL
ncbi:uncharacterized protein RCO7_03912 [Rhynchosporium graminicola]|uniref:Uncharacterized protein n=1 Tax=Rhynchosporium graminicola TaxID=2792576 RepID=A0A1E1L7Y6_9HELO|nr:uncharacterized protein RCO7_03912 [Rhynchosporium commune]